MGSPDALVGFARLSLVAAAARNNADWCDAFCRSRGIAGRFAPECWSSPRRTPPLYPDAVTLVPGVAPELLLARVEAGDGCSVKDSFADVDLAPSRFRHLFRAEWVALGAGAPSDAGDARFAEIVAGDGRAMATFSAGVIGLTNVKGTNVAAAWLGAAAAARDRWGRLPVVGYEQGDVLEALLEAGFRSIGELTVWIR